MGDNPLRRHGRRQTLHLFFGEHMQVDFGLVNLFNQVLVAEAFDHVDRDNDFAVMAHELVNDMHTFAKEVAFAFATLFGREG